MSVRQDQPVAVDPSVVGRVGDQMAGQEDVRGRSHSHGSTCLDELVQNVGSLRLGHVWHSPGCPDLAFAIMSIDSSRIAAMLSSSVVCAGIVILANAAMM